MPNANDQHAGILYIIGANVPCSSSLFENVFQHIKKTTDDGKIFFSYVQASELFRGEFVDNSSSTAGAAMGAPDALIVVWEVDRAMPQRHWENLFNFVSKYSRKDPLPVLVIANLSGRILTGSLEYVHKLSGDIRFFCDLSLSYTPSRECWRLMLMRDNNFQEGYFSEHLEWIYSKSCLSSAVAVNWTKHSTLRHKMSHGMLDMHAGRHFQKASDLPGSPPTAKWFSGMDGQKFLTKTCDGLLARLSTREFENLIKSLTESIVQTERVLGAQEWGHGQVEHMCTEEIICFPKVSDGSSYRYVIPLNMPLQVWEAKLLIQFAIPLIRKQGHENSELNSEIL